MKRKNLLRENKNNKEGLVLSQTKVQWRIKLCLQQLDKGVGPGFSGLLERNQM